MLAMNWQAYAQKRQEARPRAGPQRLAAGRPDAHRRDARAGDRERALRAGRLALLLPRDRLAAARGRRERRRRRSATLVEPGLRRDRHARRRDRRSSSGCRSRAAASAPSCTWPPTGPTSRTPRRATSCSRATSCRTSRRATTAASSTVELAQKNRPAAARGLRWRDPEGVRQARRRAGREGAGE